MKNSNLAVWQVIMLADKYQLVYLQPET